MGMGRGMETTIWKCMSYRKLIPARLMAAVQAGPRLAARARCAEPASDTRFLIFVASMLVGVALGYLVDTLYLSGAGG
jgi:hypothetical protein